MATYSYIEKWAEPAVSAANNTVCIVPGLERRPKTDWSQVCSHTLELVEQRFIIL